jgi:hypothetical protein
MKLRILSASAFGLALAAAACSHQTDQARIYTAAPAATAHGPYPRGQVTAATALDLTKRGPRLTLLAPDRGAQIASSTQATVTLQATSVNQVVAVTVEGVSAAAIGSTYQATVSLTPGTNFIHAEAIDNLGQKGESTFTLVQGTFQPMDQFLTSPVVACLSTSGLVKIEPLVDTAVGSIGFATLLQQANPLVSGAGLVTVDAVSFTYNPPRTTVTGTANGGQLAIELGHAMLTVQADALGLPITQGTVSADTATGTFVVTVNRTPAFLAAHGPLGLEATCTGLTFQNLFLSSPVPAITLILQGVEPAIVQPLTNVVTQALTSAVQGLLDQAQLAGITQPLVAQIPTLAGTAPVDFELQADQAQGSLAQGLALALDAEATAPQPFSPQATTQVLVSGVKPPIGVVPAGDFACLISEDAANAFLQAYWLAGGTSLTLSGVTQPSTFLTARVLYPFLPQVTEIAPDGDTPLVVELSCASPPLATFGGAANPVAITVGETQVRILLDFQDGKPPLELFTLRVPFELTATVSVVNGAIVIANLQAPVVSVDVVSEPVTPLDDLAITSFLAQLLPFVLDQYRQQLPPIPIPALPLGLTLSNAGITPEPGYVDVWGSF